MGKLVEAADGGLIVVQLSPKEEAQNDLAGPPSYIKPGTGGTPVVMPNGNKVLLGGEALRQALLRGAKVNVLMPTGKEFQLGGKELQQALKQGGKIVGAVPPTVFKRREHLGLNIE
jgi:hypothetical protein